MMKVVHNGHFMGYLTDDTDIPWLTHPNYAAMLMHTLCIHNATLALPKEDISIKTIEYVRDTYEKDKRRPMTELKLITGGGDTPTTGNWLLDLPVGARFCVQSKDIKNFMALDLELVNKTSRCGVLYELTSGQPLGGTGRVVAARFVSLFDKVEMLPKYEDMLAKLAQQEETTEETSNGNGDRSTDVDSRGSSGDVADDSRTP